MQEYHLKTLTEAAAIGTLDKDGNVILGLLAEECTIYVQNVPESVKQMIKIGKVKKVMRTGIIEYIIKAKVEIR
jgi:hypothetical protein